MIVVLITCAALLAGSAQGAFPPKVKIAAVFDHLSDRKHELAFRYGIERVNRDRTVLPNVQLEPVIVTEMSGSRYCDALFTLFCILYSVRTRSTHNDVEMEQKNDIN